MMRTKYLIINILASLLLLISFVTIGCDQSEDPEDYTPKLYVFTTLKNGMLERSEVVQSPTSIIMPKDTVEFFVHISKEESHDITVSVTENPTLAHEYDTLKTPLPIGSVKILEQSVVIPAGKTISTKPLRISLKQTKDVESLKGEGIIALQITTNSGIEILKGRDVCYWTISKQVRNIFQGSTNGITPYPINLFTLKANVRSNHLRRLYDSRPNTQWFCEKEGWLQLLFNKKSVLSGLAIWPYDNNGDYSGSPKIIELFTSKDGEEWQSLGIVEFPLPSAYSPLVLRLYSPLEVEYVKIVFHEGFSEKIRMAELAVYH